MQATKDDLKWINTTMIVQQLSLLSVNSVFIVYLIPVTIVVGNFEPIEPVHNSDLLPVVLPISSQVGNCVLTSLTQSSDLSLNCAAFFVATTNSWLMLSSFILMGAFVPMHNSEFFSVDCVETCVSSPI